MTKQNILHLTQVYDLTPFLYTRLIHISNDITAPQSHPVLTLNTINFDKPKKILSTLLHEQIHWWMMEQKTNGALAMSELKKIYLKVPGIAGADKESTYLHLIICYLELKALAFYIGEKSAREVILESMTNDKIYSWIYNQVLNKDFAIKKIVAKYKLLPPPLI